MKHLSLFITILAFMSGMSAQGQNDVKQDATKNQAQLKLTDGTSKYYNTADFR